MSAFARLVVFGSFAVFLLAAAPISRLTETRNNLNESLSRLIGKTPVVAGPNCWNLALNAIGITGHVRMTGPEEFRAVLDYFCTPRPRNAQASAGDLGVITTRDGSELHAYYVQSATRFLTKDLGSMDESVDLSFKVQSEKKILESYQKSMAHKDCKNGKADEELSPCGAKKQYYSCNILKIKNAQTDLKTIDQDFAQKLIAVERGLEDLHFKGRGELSALVSKLSELNVQLQTALEQKSKLKSLSKDGFRLLQFRLQGLQEGTIDIDDKDLNRERRLLSQKLLALAKLGQDSSAPKAGAVKGTN